MFQIKIFTHIPIQSSMHATGLSCSLAPFWHKCSSYTHGLTPFWWQHVGFLFSMSTQRIESRQFQIGLHSWSWTGCFVGVCLLQQPPNTFLCDISISALDQKGSPTGTGMLQLLNINVQTHCTLVSLNNLKSVGLIIDVWYSATIKLCQWDLWDFTPLCVLIQDNYYM